jgi:hypothetical protein
VESGAEHEVYWNFADDDSVRVPPGLYRVIIQLDDFQCHGDIELQYPQDWVP